MRTALLTFWIAAHAAVGQPVDPPPGSRAFDISSRIENHWRQDYQFLESAIASMGRNKPSKHPAEVRPSDRIPTDVVLRRTGALIDKLQSVPGIGPMDQYRKQLEILTNGARNPGHGNRFEVYTEACRLRRAVALSNPLLDFEKILFISFMPGTFLFQGEHLAWEAINNHRYGLFVLSGYKSENWAVTDLLRHAVVQNGRLKGRNLGNHNPEWGGRAMVHSPHIDFEAGRVLFSWALSTATPDDPLNPRPPHNRTPDTTFDLFSIDLDGSELRQLTDEHYWDNYDACYMPDGRILFVSDRRNAQERCGTWRTAGTMFSMKPDGSDVVQLSWHETNERYPSIDNDGMIVYSRWDYIDRDFYAAHDFWICSPDGRDPRSPHGNYDECRPFDPMAECAIRAIPGTTGKYMAIETGHHLAHRGNVVVLDMRQREDSGRRIRMFWPTWKKHSDGYPLHIVRNKTEPVLEAKAWDPQERSKWRWFTEPYPLSEDFVVVTEFRKILLLDSLGNEIVLFDGEDLTGDFTPLRWATPVRKRQRPPILPTKTWQGERRTKEGLEKAVISVMNVYESDFPWPEGTKITALRILQVIPKAWRPWKKLMDTPVVGYSDGGLVRQVLGTVPVEADGSAYFYAPVEREILFQALDEKGRAVQTMRSGTYVHPGEHLTCVGCHEDKHRAPSIPETRPLALQRPPSTIRPDVDGSLPFNYYRLVKLPVFDKKCTPCHQKEGKGISFDYWKNPPDQSGEGLVGEVEEYVRYFHASGHHRSRWKGVGFLNNKRDDGRSLRYRSLPGTCGALGSPLLDYLGKSHHGVDLTPEEYHRVVLWLDSNCQELGCYDPSPEALAAQRRGEPKWPLVDVDPANPTGVQADGKNR